MTTYAKQAIVGALRDEWSSIDSLLSDLHESEWARPTNLPGWTVQDNVAHIVGTESMLAGLAAPEVEADVGALPHVRNDIAAANEVWIESLRAAPAADVHARFEEITTERLAALDAMTQDEFDAESWTPAGQANYGRFMQIRVFDCWLHEQDIRDAVDRPGHESGPVAEIAVDEVVTALGYVVGKRGGAPDGSAVTIELRGPVHRDLHVQVDGRAAVVPELDREPTTTLTMPSGLFMRLTGGRVDPADHLGEISIAGDTELGTKIANNLAFTI